MSNHDDRIRRDQMRLARIGMSRRQFLGRGGALLGGLAIGPAVLAACGGSSGSSGSSSSSHCTARPGPLQFLANVFFGTGTPRPNGISRMPVPAFR